MIIVDGHCDTITKIVATGEGLNKNSCHIDLSRLKQYDGFVQFFSAFIEPTYISAYAMKWALKAIDMLYKQIELHNDDISLCCNYNDIQKALKHKKIAAILSIEDGVALQGELSSLRMFYKLGVRSICLTWNHRNEIADGVSDASSMGGLTPFGREVILEMNKLGMLVDVSHISENGFWDVMELSQSPIIASHSNAKKICTHPRNLSDEQIKAIKENNGVVGINLYSDFLNDSGNASISDVLRHIEHICSIAGTDHIGFGCDFDGIDKTPQSINGVQDLTLIIDSLLKLNYSDTFIEKITNKNFLRVISTVLG